MIIAVAGRRVDAPDSIPQRFPATSIESVKQQIAQFLKSHSAHHVVCSAACGTDLLAIQAAREIGILFTLVLPFEPNIFRSSSVIDRPGKWGDMYDDLIREVKDSPRLVVLDHDANDPEVYTKTNLEILDEAERLNGNHRSAGKNSDENADDIIALIVWEGKPKDADDTTHHFMLEAQKRNIQTEQIKIGI